LINVPELKAMGIKSFIVYDKRKPLAPMAQEFFQILREKVSPTIPAEGKGPQVGAHRTVSVH
jgi:hypothetical protein